MSLDVTKAWVSRMYPHEKMLTTCRFSPCGKFVAAGSTDTGVIRWELESAKKTVLEGHGSWISALEFAGERLLTADVRGTVHAWPYLEEAPKPAWSIQEAHPVWLRALAASPCGKRFATGGHDRVARVWDAGSGKLVREFSGHEGYVFSVAFHPDGKSLVTGDLFGTIRHWDLESGKLVRELDAKVLHTRGEDFLADVGGVRSMTFDAEGKRLAASGLREAKSNTFCPGRPTVVVFDWASGETRQHGVKEEKTDGPANRTRFLSDGSLAGAGEGQSLGGLWFWKGEAADPIHSVNAPSLYDLDLHPDGERLAAAGFEAKGRGGNGRHTARGEYVANAGAVRVYSLTPQPGPKKK